MTKEVEEHYRNNNFCRFCEKEKHFNKVRDHCYLTGKNIGPAHSNCIISKTQKRRFFSFCISEF